MNSGEYKGNYAFLQLPHSPFQFSSSPEQGQWCSTRRLPRHSSWPSTVTMLRVQDKRRPEDWDRKTSTLSGRFLPMDPRDEKVLDVLESNARGPFVDSYGPEGPPTDAYGGPAMPTEPRKWSKRSEAARKRWADPVYRAKMLEKRAEKRRRDAEANGENVKGHKLEIGCMDSVTLSDENKAQAINAYARSNKLRSEKITAFHRNRKLWMETRLDDSPKNLSDDEYVQTKIDLREKRRQSALKRAAIRRNGGKNAQTPIKPSSKSKAASASDKPDASDSENAEGEATIADDAVVEVS